MKPITKRTPREPLSEADFEEVERQTVRQAEDFARRYEQRTEDVLGDAAADAQLTGRTPAEIISRWLSEEG